MSGNFMRWFDANCPSYPSVQQFGSRVSAVEILDFRSPRGFSIGVSPRNVAWMLCRDTPDYVWHVPKANVHLDKKEKGLGLHLLHPIAVIQLEVCFDANFSVHAGSIWPVSFACVGAVLCRRVIVESKDSMDVFCWSFASLSHSC